MKRNDIVTLEGTFFKAVIEDRKLSDINWMRWPKNREDWISAEGELAKIRREIFPEKAAPPRKGPHACMDPTCMSDSDHACHDPNCNCDS